MEQPPFPRQVLQNTEDRLAFGALNPPPRVVKNRIILSLIKRALSYLTTTFLPIPQNKQTRQIIETSQNFAAANGLSYFKFQREHWIFGQLQEYEVVYHIDEAQKKLSLTCKRLTPIASWYKNYSPLKYKDYLEKPVTVEVISRLFSHHLRNLLPNPIKFDASGDRIFYEEDDIWVTPASLQQLFETLSDFANTYAHCCAMVVAAGGEAGIALEQIAANETHKLRSIAIQLLRDIAQVTELELSHKAPVLLCPHCLARCTTYQVSLPQGETLTYFGCRVCRQSRNFLEFKGQQLVAVLDRGLSVEQVQAEQELRVNWLIRRQLFDFDQVEIVRASDEEVERFAVQVGNDTDSLRRPRYQQMKCMVSPECELSENTMRILRRMFGNVEVGQSFRA